MKIIACRSTQWPMWAEFVFNWNDYVADSADLAAKTLGGSVGDASLAAAGGGVNINGLTGPVAGTVTFDCIPMCVGAVIIGGEIIVETPYVGPGAATLNLGVAGDLSALASAVDMKAAAGTRTELVLTKPLLCNAGQNVRATIAWTVANATAGKVRIRVAYTVDTRANEVQTG